MTDAVALQRYWIIEGIRALGHGLRVSWSDENFPSHRCAMEVRSNTRCFT